MSFVRYLSTASVFSWCKASSTVIIFLIICEWWVRIGLFKHAQVLVFGGGGIEILLIYPSIFDIQQNGLNHDNKSD